MIVSVIVALGVVSFALCIAAEFKKSKVRSFFNLGDGILYWRAVLDFPAMKILQKEDLRLDGEFCYLPRSAAFGLGIAALVCFSGAQVAGNLLVIGRTFLLDKRRKSKFVIFCVVLSWVSFGVAAILMGTATSMNKSQPLGEGWLDGECYMVKNGVFSASAILIIITVASTLASALITTQKRQLVEQATKIAQIPPYSPGEPATMAVVWVGARPNLAEIYTPPAHESSRKPLHTRVERKTVFPIDALDMSKLSLFDEDRPLPLTNGIEALDCSEAAPSRPRSVSKRSNDRSETRMRCCSVGASAIVRRAQL
nr:Glutamate receptor 3.1 like [Ipomoea batatas]